MKKSDLPSKVFPPGAKNVPDLRIAAKKWAAQNRDLPAKEFELIITSLILEPSAMKKCMGGILLGYMPAQRGMIDPFLYEKWLDHAVGWAEVDAICYGNFTAAEILADFKSWKLLIKKLAQSDNINERRASIVLLTKPVKDSPDKRLSALAFSIIDKLMEERAPLLTKAISWLLRNLIRFNRIGVEEYLHSNIDTLPKIALRETANKLRSGRKSGL